MDRDLDMGMVWSGMAWYCMGWGPRKTSFPCLADTCNISVELLLIAIWCFSFRSFLEMELYMDFLFLGWGFSGSVWKDETTWSNLGRIISYKFSKYSDYKMKPPTFKGTFAYIKYIYKLKHLKLVCLIDFTNVCTGNLCSSSPLIPLFRET